MAEGCRCTFDAHCLNKTIPCASQIQVHIPNLISFVNRVKKPHACGEECKDLSPLPRSHPQDNRISDLESLCDPVGLGPLTSLRALYLQNLDRTLPNPVCGQPRYKARVLAQLPALTNLDGER